MTRDVPVFGSLVKEKKKKKKKREKNNVIKGLSFARFATTKKRRREESERRKATTNRRRAHLVSSTVFPATRRRSCSFLTRVFVKTNGEKKDAFFLLVYKQSKAQSYCLPPPLLPESGRVSPRLLRGAQRTLDQRLRPKRESPKYRPREVLEEDSKKEKKIHKGVDAQKTHRTKRS